MDALELFLVSDLNFLICVRRDDAKDILSTAQLVRNALEEARKVQDEAKQAIEQAKLDIQDAEDDLKQVCIMCVCDCDRGKKREKGREIEERKRYIFSYMTENTNFRKTKSN